MTRYAIMAITAGLALLIFVGLFYVTGMAIGIAFFGVVIIALIAAAIYGALKWRGRSRGGRP